MTGLVSWSREQQVWAQALAPAEDSHDEGIGYRRRRHAVRRFQSRWAIAGRVPTVTLRDMTERPETVACGSPAAADDNLPALEPAITRRTQQTRARR